MSTILPAPGPQTLLTVEFARHHNNDPLAMLSALFARYGDFVHYKTRFNEFFLVSDPELARQVMVDDNFVRSPILKSVLGNGLLAADGPHWERQRRVMLPEFKPIRIESLVETFYAVVADRLRVWETRAAGSSPLGLNREMERIALSSICQTLLDWDLGDEFLDAFAEIMRELGGLGNAADFGIPLVRRADSNQKFRSAMRVVDDSIAEILSAPRPRLGRLLSTLHRSPRPLSRQQIRDEVVTMITAGHETSAVVLGWAWLSIMQHPAVAARFYEEVDSVLGQRPIQAEDLPKLTYTRAILDETLRLYPPVWLVGRTPTRNTRLGEFEIPANAGVLVSPFLLHRHPNHWVRPNEFRPERFLDTAHQQSSAYIPFLSGRHLCLGKHFAITETVVVLATIAQRFHLHRCDDWTVTFEPLVSLRMRGSLDVHLEPRATLAS